IRHSPADLGARGERRRTVSRIRAVATSTAPVDVQGTERQGDRADHAERPPERLLSVGNDAASDERDADPVQTVVEDPEDQQHVERQEEPVRPEPKEPAPSRLPAQQHRQHGEVQVKVRDEPESGHAVDREGEAAERASPRIEPAGRRDPDALAQHRSIVTPSLGARELPTAHAGFTVATVRCPVARTPRSAMIRSAGRTLEGHASVHSNAAWQRQAPIGSSAQSRIRSGSTPRGSSSSRCAAASAAGPTYASEVAETGHADRQRPHSMQSSNRSYASIPSGGEAWGSSSLIRTVPISSGNRSKT